MLVGKMKKEIDNGDKLVDHVCQFPRSIPSVNRWCKFTGLNQKIVAVVCAVLCFFKVMQVDTFYEQILSFAVYSILILYDDWVGAALMCDF